MLYLGLIITLLKLLWPYNLLVVSMFQEVKAATLAAKLPIIKGPRFAVSGPVSFSLSKKERAMFIMRSFFLKEQICGLRTVQSYETRLKNVSEEKTAKLQKNLFLLFPMISKSALRIGLS